MALCSCTSSPPTLLSLAFDAQRQQQELSCAPAAAVHFLRSCVCCHAMSSSSQSFGPSSRIAWTRPDARSNTLIIISRPTFSSSSLLLCSRPRDFSRVSLSPSADSSSSQRRPSDRDPVLSLCAHDCCRRSGEQLCTRVHPSLSGCLCRRGPRNQGARDEERGMREAKSEKSLAKKLQFRAFLCDFSLPLSRSLSLSLSLSRCSPAVDGKRERERFLNRRRPLVALLLLSRSADAAVQQKVSS